jgi:pimeloyl-ACP methyl ester carboxylesterase
MKASEASILSAVLPRTEADRGSSPLLPKAAPSRAGACVLLAAAFILLADRGVRAQLNVHPCGQAGQRARCGTLDVPENPLAPEGRRLRLNVAVISAAGAGPLKEPLFVLKGGPGQAATADAEDLIETSRAVRAEHDLVLLDQRGTGGAGRLDCEVAEGRFLVPRNPTACLARLAAGADLRMYSTERYVDDLETARAALGYEQISVYGSSYGTRVAYQYARRHPDRVRALVLVAPAPVSMPLLDSFEEDGDRALADLVKDCASDRACSSAFAGLEAQLQKVRTQLNDPYHAIGMSFLQYSSSTSRYIPALVSEAARGRREPLDRAIAAVRDRFLGQLSIGLHLSVMCSEELARDAAPAGRASALRAEYETACRGWPRTDVRNDSGTPPIAARALIVVGERDPVTSPRWARVMADQFRDSRVMVVPGEGHLFDGAMLKCIDTVAADFLGRREIADACVRGHTKPAYVLRAQ